MRRRGWPVARPVTNVQDSWRIDDEWWREHPVSRLYYALLLADDTVLAVYYDRVTNRWYEQKG